MAESNPNSFNCSAKKDIANKPFKIGDPTNYFEDPVVCSGFIDVQGIPSRPTDIEITNGDVRIYTGNLQFSIISRNLKKSMETLVVLMNRH